MEVLAFRKSDTVWITGEETRCHEPAVIYLWAMVVPDPEDAAAIKEPVPEASLWMTTPPALLLVRVPETVRSALGAMVTVPPEAMVRSLTTGLLVVLGIVTISVDKGTPIELQLVVVFQSVLVVPVQVLD